MESQASLKVDEGGRREKIRDGSMSRTQPDLAGFEDEGRRQIPVGFKCSPFGITVRFQNICFIS